MARKRRYSTQNLSHYKLGSYKMGLLYPLSITEVLPGDIFRHSTSLFMRVSPLVTPVMHPVHVRIFHFYVPLRLLWDDFEEFRTGGEDGLSSPEFPTRELSGSAVGGVGNHFGLPVWDWRLGDNPSRTIRVSALPWRAYTLIWNEWFRDQETTEPVEMVTTSGPDTSPFPGILPYSWAKDYFTTASLTPQRGPEVTIPVNSPGSRTLNVVPSSDDTPFSLRFPTIDYQSKTGFVDIAAQETARTQSGNENIWKANPTLYFDYTNNNDNGHQNLVSGNVYWPSQTGLQVDVSSSSGDLGSISIADWREAMALQRFEEHRALYGSRYTEYLRSLGIRASDARLQRPEYLGGSRDTVQFSEVLQTAQDGNTPVGTLRGHGIAATKTAKYRRFFEEDGFVVSLMAVMPVPVYMQGIDKMWLRKTKEDFWNPEFQHLSQQPVYTQELYYDAPDDEVFGYQDIYDEYRGHRSFVAGEMSTILNDWHFAREFAEKPDLNRDFIYGSPAVRPFASQETDTLYVMAHHSIIAKRLMSRRGTPR